MSRIEPIQQSREDRDRLEKLVRDRNTPQKVVWRSRIVLLSAAGLRPPAVAAAVGKSALTVRRWRRRFLAQGVDGLLKDATRPPGKKPLSPEVIKRVVELTLNQKPPGRTHWSERSMATRVGLAPSTVHNIWKAHGLKARCSGSSL
jgi:transposase